MISTRVKRTIRMRKINCNNILLKYNIIMSYRHLLRRWWHAMRREKSKNLCCCSRLVNRDRRSSCTSPINLCISPSTDSGDDTSANLLYFGIFRTSGALTCHVFAVVNGFQTETRPVLFYLTIVMQLLVPLKFIF